MRHIPGTSLIRFDDVLLRELMTRDDDCNLLTLEVSEPDADGVCTATCTRHYDDNPYEAEREVSAWLASKLTFTNTLVPGTNYPGDKAADWLRAARKAVAS